MKKFSKRIENYNWEITKVERYGKVLLEEDGNPYRGRSLGRTFFGKEYKLESHDNDMMEQLQSEAETQ